MTFELRPYQQKLIEDLIAIHSTAEPTEKLLAVSPTGSGKTVVMAALTKQMGLNTLVVSQRNAQDWVERMPAGVRYPYRRCCHPKEEKEGRDTPQSQGRTQDWLPPNLHHTVPTTFHSTVRMTPHHGAHGRHG